MSTTQHQKLTITKLISETREQLLPLGYSKSTLQKMGKCWRRFAEYAEDRKVTTFTLEFGYQYLKETYDIEPFERLSSSNEQIKRRSIMVLSDYQRYGFIRKRQDSKPHEWVIEYRDICNSFMQHPQQQRLGAGSLRLYRIHLERFTRYLVSIGVQSISEVCVEHIDSYIQSYLGYANSTIAYACYVLKTFLKYAKENGYISENIASAVPHVKVNQRANLPSTFTTEEIKRLLASVDRGNPVGKRDYAVLLLAIRYGMRVGEITALKLSDLDFTFKKITYTQGKTGTQIQTDMLDSIGWALIDYLKNARPTTDSPNVFVRMVAPFDSFAKSNNLSNIMQKYLTRAGIKKPDNRHYGMHTFRHSLAGHMLENGESINTIAETLGHLEINNAMIYTKIDLNSLMLCALEVPNEN